MHPSFLASSVLSGPGEVTTNSSAGRCRRQGCSGTMGEAQPGLSQKMPGPMCAHKPFCSVCAPVPGRLSAAQLFIRFTLQLLLLHCFIDTYLNFCLFSLFCLLTLPSPSVPSHAPPASFCLVLCFPLSQRDTGLWQRGCAGPGMVRGRRWKGPRNPWPPTAAFWLSTCCFPASGEGTGPDASLLRGFLWPTSPLGTAQPLVNAGPGPPSAGGERAGPLEALSNGNRDI